MDSEDWADFKLIKKELKRVNNEKYLPILIEAGAEFKTEGVYRLGDYDYYPSKGKARNFRTNETKNIFDILPIKFMATTDPIELNSTQMLSEKLWEVVYGERCRDFLRRRIVNNKKPTRFKITVEEIK